MGKPLQQDENGNIMNDEVTKENQKGYSNYEADLKKRQAEMEAKEKSSSAKDRGLDLMGKGLKMLGMKKGGKVSSASKRADGIAIRGKTRA